MSYTTGTTNFNLPQYVGTDKPSWTDTNQPFAELDTAVGGVTESVATMGSRITTLETQVNDTNTGILTRLSTAESDINTVEGDVASLNTTVTSLATEVGDVRTDTEDMITAYRETSATATHNYAVNDYFIYNDVLYRATQAISSGATIVPNTNCTATNVATEIKNIGLADDITPETLFSDTINSNYTKEFDLVMPRDGHVLFKVGAANNSGVSICFAGLKLNNIEIFRLSDNVPYAQIVNVSPFIKKGSHVKISMLLSSNSWGVSELGQAEAYLI